MLGLGSRVWSLNYGGSRSLDWERIVYGVPGDGGVFSVQLIMVFFCKRVTSSILQR